MKDTPSGQESEDLPLKRNDGDDDRADSAESQSHKNVIYYDLKNPARVNKTQLMCLENLHDNFARLLSATFSGAVQEIVDVDIAFVDQITYAEFIMSLSNPSFSYQFVLGPTRGGSISRCQSSLRPSIGCMAARALPMESMRGNPRQSRSAP